MLNTLRRDMNGISCNYTSANCARAMLSKAGQMFTWCMKGIAGKPYRCGCAYLQDVTDLPESTKAFAPAPAPQNQYESTNMWEYKPQWCQPWTILLTGTTVISAVNFLSHSSYLFTGLIAVPVLVWWYLFLVLVPAEFKSYVQEQRAKSR